MAVTRTKTVGTTTGDRQLIAELLDALQEAREEIQYWHSDMLTEEERSHCRGCGWARVYDKCGAAIARANAAMNIAPSDKATLCLPASDADNARHARQLARVLRDICTVPIEQRQRIKQAFAEAFELLDQLPKHLTHP